MKTVTVGELASLVVGEVHGDSGAVISDGQSVDRAERQHVTFAQHAKTVRKLADCNAGCVLLGRDADTSNAANWKAAAYVVVDEPMAAFLQILAVLRPARQRTAEGISPQAEIHGTARIGVETVVHPRATISEDVHIGRNCEIFPGVHVGPGCRIGDDVVLRPNVVLYNDVIVGNRVTIDSSSVIGSHGYGFRLRSGRHERIPHFGTVRIEDDVEIGACTTVDRAMIGETIIGQGTKLDNLVMIAHNCELGKHNLMAGQVGLAGSVTTGNYVVCAGQAGIADHAHLGTGCIVGSQAGVTKEVPPGETYLGSPAIPVADVRRFFSVRQKLPDALRTIRTLAEEIEQLKRHVATLAGRNAEAERAA
jgi:UDP-3-O-[3-hydroxymyristoyl] glucosamine N-acyltransferase